MRVSKICLVGLLDSFLKVPEGVVVGMPKTGSAQLLV